MEVILKVLCGSRAYGLADDDSDFDFHGVFIVPTSELLSVGTPKPKTTHWIEDDGEDDTAWELGHFLHLSLQCNPTILETFVAPIVEATDEGWELRALFPYVLSRRRIRDAFLGYSHNQRKKMFEPKGGVLAGERQWKFACAYLRVLHHGAEILRVGLYDPKVSPPIADLLRRAKHGELSLGAVVDIARDFEHDLTQAYLSSTLPEEADLGPINAFLLRVRQAHW